MRIDLKEVIPKDITIINKLNKAESATGLDVWVKHTLHECSWSSKEIETAAGTQTSVGRVTKVQIPSGKNPNYKPYHDWSKAGNQEDFWTISEGDYVVLGEVAEEVNASNIVKTMAKYKPNQCRIQMFEDLTVKLQSSGFLEQYLSIYYIEGV